MDEVRSFEKLSEDVKLQHICYLESKELISHCAKYDTTRF